MKTKLIITNDVDYSEPEESGILRFSNIQWWIDSSKLEGYEFGDVEVQCVPVDSLREWLHMHLGIRVERIIYT